MDSISMNIFGGTLTLDNDKIKIDRKNKPWIPGGTNVAGAHTIYLDNITSVSLNSAKGIQFGVLHFIIPGTTSVIHPIEDRNAVTFSKSENNTAEAIKRYVVDYIERSRETQNSHDSDTTNSADEIRKFKRLMDEGAITPEEFEAKKKQLLGL